jgi:hypothetical protein
MARFFLRSVVVVTALVGFVPATWAVDLDIALDPFDDRIGQQIYAVQTYTPAAGGQTIIDLGLYDTGASVITFSWYSNPYFPQPHLAPGGAGGEGIGGNVTGDVSRPGTILAGGIQDFTITFDPTTFDLEASILTDPDRGVAGVQAFVGTEDGSPQLPTLTGTPIHAPSVAFPGGSAGRIGFTGIDYGPSLGLGSSLFLPALDLVAAGSTLSARPGSTAPARIPLVAFGTGNAGSEGTSVTAAPNPTVANVSLTHHPDAGDATSVTASRLLLDTGAQVSLLSTSLAASLGLDLDAPETTIDVRGAAGTTITIPGFTLTGVELAAAIDGAVVDDVLRFTDVPVYVYDIGVPGLDGILGMNLFNQADEMLIDLVASEMSVTFLTDPSAGSSADAALLAALAASYPAFTGYVAPAFGLGPVVAVPEPGSLAAVAVAALAGGVLLRRGSRSRAA